MDSRRLLGPVGFRVALTLVGVALGAIAVLSALVVFAVRSEVQTLVARQQQQIAADVAGSLGRAYTDAGGWLSADLFPAHALAASAGADLRILDASGAVVSSRSGDMAEVMARMHGRPHIVGVPGPVRTVPVMVSGTTVGTAELRFPKAELPRPARQVRDALVRTVAAGAGLAALLALGVAVAMSRRITAPLVKLTHTAAAMEGGDRSARVGLAQAPGEFGELARAFDRMADALAREDQLRRSLVADVAHELRTPVTILQAQCEELRDGSVPATPERLTSLHDEVLRLGRVVEDLETLASADAAGIRLERRELDLAQVAAEAADLLAPRFAAAEIQLVPSLVPVVVLGDPTRLNQVVVNLLTNAVKFTPTGGRVSLQVGPDGSLARLAVADTGPGIPSEELPHLFQRFWRGSAARGVGGSGVGLAVVAELVRAHRGRVEVESAPGNGARFTVFLPRV